jgi:cytochrome c peroxidase
MVTYEVDPLDNVVKPKISARPPGPLNTNQYTQMEANFSLFFGLAIQLYEATLIADDCAFDRFLDGFFGSLTSQQQRGLGNYNAAGCAGCHANPETTSASFRLVQAGAPQFPYTPPFGAIELMPTGNRQPAFYDTGFNNTAVTPTANDISRSADTPFPNPAWPGTFYPLCYSDLAMLKRDSKVPSAYSIFIPTLPIGNAVPKDRIANHGAFKVSQLRNIELTGPYQHNGGQATLHQVVDFYTRGGNFADNNLMDLDPAIVPLGGLLGLPGEKNDLVAFLLSMTDQRVKNELAPFDHPELIVPHGVTTNGQEIFFRVPPVGAFGRPAELLPPLQSFLNLNPFLPD